MQSSKLADSRFCMKKVFKSLDNCSPGSCDFQVLVQGYFPTPSRCCPAIHSTEFSLFFWVNHTKLTSKN